MPRIPTHPPVTRINPAVIKEAFRKPAPSEVGYYILERGKTLVCLRVRKTTVRIGVRHNSHWHSVAPLHAEMSVQEVEDVRMAALQLARQLQDGKGFTPAAARGRSMTLALGSIRSICLTSAKPRATCSAKAPSEPMAMSGDASSFPPPDISRFLRSPSRSYATSSATFLVWSLHNGQPPRVAVVSWLTALSSSSGQPSTLPVVWSG